MAGDRFILLGTMSDVRVGNADIYISINLWLGFISLPPSDHIPMCPLPPPPHKNNANHVTIEYTCNIVGGGGGGGVSAYE
jgi:hypothetical protein